MQTQASDNQVSQPGPDINEPVGSFPLTFAQLGLWFLEQLSPGETSYLVPWSIRIQGSLNVEALEQSLNEVVRRHEILRTTFSARGGEPVQTVAAPSYLPLVQISLDHLQDREAEARRRIAAEAKQPIDLETGPIVRASLLRLSEEEHLLLLTMHHISFDGWSRGIWIREMAALYEGYRDGKEVRLPDLPIQYGDYAVWQRERCGEEQLAGELAYWKEQLAGAPATLDLPTDHPRPAVQTNSGASYRVQWPESLTRALKAVGQREGATLFMVLLAGFQALLARYSGQNDVLVGTPLANRNRRELEQLIGYFANTIVLRARLDGNPTFRELLAQVRETALGAYAHAELPFERLVEELEPVRSLSYNPIFQVLFSLRNAPQEELALPGLKLEFVGPSAESAKFDLSFFFSEHEGGLACRVEYNTDLYSGGMISGMLVHYRRLLELVVLDVGVRLGEVGLVGEEEEQELLRSWRGVEAEYPGAGSVYGLFEEQVSKTPDRVAVVCGEEELSYGELNVRANQLAYLLLSQGVGRGQRVGLYVERSLEMMVGLLGIQKSGAAYVPLDPGYPEERIRQTLEEAGTSVVVVGGGLAGRLGWYGGRVLSLEGEGLRQQSRSNPGVGAGGEDAVYVIFTSGSTGRPKGVEVMHGGVVNLLRWMGKELAMGERDVFPALASFAFDMSVPELYLSLVTGGRVVLGERHLAGNGEELAVFLRRHGATVVHATPTTWSLLLDAGFSGAGLKRVIGAEPLPQGLFERLLEADASLYNFYGPTETTVWSTYHHFRSKAERVVIGRAIANTELYILDRDGNVCPAGVRGELYIGGAGVALGYLHQPELTAERFLPNRFSGKGKLYRTGDLVRALPDGRIEFAGRVDHQVKVRGYRIELGEIESVVGAHAAVGQCVVLARQDQPGIQRLVAYVTPRQGQTLSIPELRHLVKENLPDYMTPSAWVLMPQLPRTPAGKIDRKKLPIPDGGERGSEDGSAPFTATQFRIARIWEQVLNVSPIRLEDNFFNLGGHSLLAVTLIERMRRDGFTVTVRSLFAAPTLAQLAATAGADTDAIEVPPNHIPSGCEALSPAMLPLIELTAREIKKIVSTVPGGAANVQDIYPLAPLQEGFLFHHLMGGEGDPYLLRLQFGFDTRARLDSYIGALQAVVDRHDILRTGVVWEGLTEPAQVVWRKASLQVEEVELDPAAGDVSDQLYSRYDPGRFRIDVRRAPLLRLYIAYDKEKDRWLLMQLLHHLAGDHTTLKVMWYEVQAHLLGQQEMLPAPLPFRNLVAQARLGVSQQEHEAFFRQMLGDLDEPTAPFGLLDVQGDGSGIEEAHLALDNDIARRLRAHARRLGVTAASLFHLAWARVLAKVSGRENVVFGTVLSGRMQGGEGADRVMGLFINTLPLRINVGEEAAEVSVRQTHALLADLMHHEHASLALAQRCSAVPAPAPLFSALLNYRHVLRAAQVPAAEAPQAWEGVQWLRGEERTNYPFTLSVNDLGEGFSLKAQTPASVGPLRVCEFTRTALESLVEALETCPAKAVRALDVLPAPERHRVLYEWNDTEVAYPSDKCVHQLFEEQVCKSPDAVAVVFEDDALSYAELNRRANRLANHLRGLGVMPDSRVAICVERGFEMIVALLAVLKAGGAYVPLDPAYPLERLRFMLEDSAPVALLTQAHLQGMFTDIGDRLPVLDLNNGEAPWQDLRSDNTDPHAIGLGPGHLAYVIYTSGSTGQPKGVSIEHHNVVNFIAWAQSSFTADILKRTLFSTSLNFDLAVYECFVPLISGATVRIVPNALYLARTQVDVTLINTVPSAINTIIEMHGIPETVLMVNLAGEPLRNTLVQRIFTTTHVDTVCNLYGPSETTTYSTWVAVKRGEPFTSHIGRPIANTRIHILDAHGEPVPVGVAGELYIGGAGVARGYLNRPELTAEKFLADPFSSDTHARMYRTGDLGRYLPDGNIEFLGRNDFQVKLRGFRIELGEIETLLADHARVREAVVIAREDTPGDKRLVAYYTTLTEDAAPVGELLRAHLTAALPEYMVPAAYVRLKGLPLTPNGKLDRKALPPPEADAYSSRSYEAPQGKTEIQLARIWAEVLRLDRVGRHDDFFNLGGHSLLAVKMIARVRECFGDSFPLATLFQTSTLGGLARVLELESARVPLPTIIPIRSSGAKPALFCVSRPNVNALGFIFLARHLAPDQPVFGLQTQMKEDGSFWTYNQQDYEAKAAEYISAMREVQPNGPYLLTGFCEGAHIAFEMARQLEACNVPVAMIAILDAWPIENTVSRVRFKLRGYFRGLQRWALMDHKEQARFVQAKLRRTSSPHPGVGWFEGDPWTLGAEFRTMRAEQMKKRYWPGPDFTPPTYGGRLTLFRTKKQDFCRIRDYQMGWGSRALGGVDVIPIPGPHALILREPYVVDLAKKMEACIEYALENGQETPLSGSDTYPAVPATA